MRIGYRTAGLGELDFTSKLQLCHRLNLTAIEVTLREFQSEAPEAVRNRAHAMGIAITAVAGAMNPSVPSALDETLAVCEQNLTLCRALGVDFLYTRSMWPEAEVPQPDTWDHLIPTMRHLAQMCADAGVRLGLEVDHGCFIDTLERAERLMEAVDHDNLYFNFDPTNFYLGGSDPLTVLDRHHHRILNGHIKDGVYRYRRREEVPIGAGEVPYREIFTRINELGMDIAMNIEHCNSVQCVTAAAQFVHRVLSELGIVPSVT